MRPKIPLFQRQLNPLEGICVHQTVSPEEEEAEGATQPYSGDEQATQPYNAIVVRPRAPPPQPGTHEGGPRNTLGIKFNS